MALATTAKASAWARPAASDGSPGLRGTARATMLGPTSATGGALASASRLFALTAVVNALSSDADGMGSTFTEPRLACT